MKTALIAIQARSTSSRLPNKCNMQVGGRPILQWVLDSCQVAARFLRSDNQNLKTAINVAILTPKGDPIADLYKSQVPVIEGSEHDVLSRFVTAQKQMGAHYIARITADCLYIPPHHITKHVKAAILKDRDYTTNTHHRTHKEGWDCEVLSARLLEWLDQNASEPYDREHVTTLIAAGKPFPFRYVDGKPSVCHILNQYDESEIKTSIDTREEYEAAERHFQKLQKAKLEANRNGTYMT